MKFLLTIWTFLITSLNNLIMKNNINNIHALVGSNFENFDDNESYDDDNFEELYEEHYNEVENYIARGLPRPMAQKRANDKVMTKYGNRGTTFVNSLRKNTNVALATNKGANMGIGSFDLVITRLTSRLAIDLPIMLFAPIYRECGYTPFINEFLPAGIFCTIAPSVGGGILFNFTDGTLTDQVVIVCNQTPYSSMLSAILGGDKIVTSKTRYKIAKNSYTIQYDRKVQVQSKSIFGSKNATDITINSYIEPTQFQSGIVDVKVEMPFDREIGLLMLVAPSPTSTTTMESFQLTMFLKAVAINNVKQYAQR